MQIVLKILIDNKEKKAKRERSNKLEIKKGNNGKK